MSNGEPTTADAIAALERFVVENDELLALEERIGRFNIFDALGIARAEIRHSNFLAWLLDPAESHGQGPLFLRAILMDLLKTARENGDAAPISPIQLDAAELRGVEVRREWKHIDLLIKCDEPKFVIAIENKVDSGEHGNQLENYAEKVKKEFGGDRALLVYLTRDGDSASDPRWMPYSYRNIYAVLTDIAESNKVPIADDVSTFLTHYRQLIRSKFMDDPATVERCREIYRKHRRAIDLIFRHGKLDTSSLTEQVRRIVDENHGVTRIPTNGKSVYFIPNRWLETLTEIRKNAPWDKRQWFCCEFKFPGGRAALWLYACPTIDKELRSRVIRRLTKNPSEFGFKHNKKDISPKWATIYRKRVATWDTELPDEETFEEKIRLEMNDLVDRMDRAVPAIAETIRVYQEQTRT